MKGIFSLSLLLAGVVFLPPAIHAQVHQDDRLVALLGNQINADFALYGAVRDGPGEPALRVELVANLAEHLQLWRGSYPASHSKWYLVALDSAQAFRLGGFSDTDLGALVDRLGSTQVPTAGENRLAKSVAMLLDPYGASRLVYVDDPVTEERTGEIVTAWRSIRPSDWPSDTTLLTPSGILVRLTVLTQNTRAIGMPWTGRLYTIVFDQGGRIKSWSSRSSSAFTSRTKN